MATAGVDGASYPATGVNATVLESAVNAGVEKDESLTENELEYDGVNEPSKDGVNVVEGANVAPPPSPIDPIPSTITFKSPSFEWSGAPLFKQQLSQASAGYWKFCLIEPGYRMGVLKVVRVTG